MLRKFTAAALALAACAAVASAQTQAGAGASASHSTSVGREGGRLDLASGTRVTGELQGALDASRARVGDRVVLRTTEAIKQNGRTVLKKGVQLVGRVADVRRRAGASAASSVTVVFDTLQSGSLSAPVVATIDSVARVSGRAGADDDFGVESSASARGSASGSASGGASGGGLLGGVAGAVGNTVGGVAGAAGDAVGSTAEAVGGAARGAGSALGRVQVTQAVGLSAEGGSTLSLAGGDLRLEKGTTFRLTVSEAARVGGNR
ncbi:MAG TPA: hypothetical protein VF668_23055 [Pyrinomonadaceae bacterium]|jgi:hypothetical protein